VDGRGSVDCNSRPSEVFDGLVEERRAVLLGFHGYDCGLLTLVVLLCCMLVFRYEMHAIPG